jgi:hypothetical protein
VSQNPVPMGALSVARLLLLRAIHAAFATLFVGLGWYASMRRAVLRQFFRQTPLAQQSLPAHVGIVVGQIESEDMSEVSMVINGCIAHGIRYITLCDLDGTLQRAAPVLRSCLQSTGGVQLLSPGEPPALVADAAGQADAARQADMVATHGVYVRVLSLQTGRDDLVCAARRLCQEVVAGTLACESVDEAHLDSELNANAGFPEPVRHRQGFEHQCAARACSHCLWHSHFEVTQSSDDEQLFCAGTHSPMWTTIAFGRPPAVALPDNPVLSYRLVASSHF